MESYIIDEQNDVQIKPLYIGWERCESGHSFGPYVRDCYLIHFCLGGRGILENSEGVSEVGMGDFFVIRPTEVTKYTADVDDPWEYVWIAFSSGDNRYFPAGQSVFETPSGIDEKLLHLVKSESKSAEGCLAIIYDLLYRTSDFTEKESDGTVARHIKRYVKYNYMLPITVSALAREFGFERSYLYRVFKARYGIGIKEYITSVRLKMGEKFLKEGYSVGESAKMCGYEDRFNFSKAYKAYFGISPSSAIKKQL